MKFIAIISLFLGIVITVFFMELLQSILRYRRSKTEKSFLQKFVHYIVVVLCLVGLGFVLYCGYNVFIPVGEVVNVKQYKPEMVELIDEEYINTGTLLKYSKEKNAYCFYYLEEGKYKEMTLYVGKTKVYEEAECLEPEVNQLTTYNDYSIFGQEWKEKVDTSYEVYIPTGTFDKEEMDKLQ